MEKSYLKKIRGGTICLIFTILLCASCNFEKLSLSQTQTESSGQITADQKQFDTFLDQLFASEVVGSTLNLHYTLTNPKEFGIKSYEITYGDLSENSMKEGQAELENTVSAMKSFRYKVLSTDQKLTYDILKDYLDMQTKLSDYNLYDEVLRPTTGIAAQLPVLLAEYSFNSNKDVTDYLTLLSLTKDYFNQIINVEEKKSQAGLFMSDFAADAVITSCESFIAEPDNNFLISTFQNRLANVADISEDKRAEYISQNNSLVQNNIIPAYEKLAAAMNELKGSGTNDGGLCNYKKGSKYYEYLVRSNTGSDMDIKSLEELVISRRTDNLTKLNTLLTDNPTLLDASADMPILEDNPIAILDKIQENMKADFLPAVDTNYEVNYVEPSLEASTSPAFYLTAPIDDTSHNVIYINNSSRYSGIQLFTTLAHEGYPGHLYQTTASYQAGLAPIRALLNYSGYVEGWATYVEMLSYDYADLDKDFASMLVLNQSAILSLYASADMGIHYDGWTRADVKDFFNNYGIKDDQSINSIYELIVEEPSHYLKYYIGYLEFLQLRDYAKSMYGVSFSPKAFHEAIVTMGPAPFSILKKYLPDYYDTNLK